MRLDEARRELVALFSQSESPAADADCLLCAVLGCSRTWLRTWPEHPLSSEQWQRVQALAERRRQGEPIAHLIGEREFWSLPLKVSADTLIPRPDTEVLVEQALAHLSADASHVLDLGTGTGAIALALKQEHPECRVVAVDRIAAACALAQENSQRLGLTIEVRQGCWFDPVRGERFALIVSNPPYIDADDPHLLQGDVRFEPNSALVADEQGFADLAHIIAQAPAYLLDSAWLLLEHGWQQGARVRELFLARGFTQVETVRDYGGQERVTLGQWQGEGF
ncbi:MAG: peptide chain release factor N(5)-glutamine methyltransferase [Aeromonadaceae bacterium]